MADQQARGIGIDLGSTALRVGAQEGGHAHLVHQIPVPAPVSHASRNGHFIEFGFLKRNLGSGQRIGAGRKFTAEQLATEFFSQARQVSEHMLHARLLHAVVSVPPYFTDRQSAATVDCARHAGFQQVVLVHDSVAAVLAGGVSHASRGRILVLGLGRSSFWVSLVDFQEKIINEMAHNSDAQAGMDELDRLLLEKLAEFGSAPAVNGDGALLNRARALFRDVDRELSANSQMAAQESLARKSGYSYLLDLLYSCSELKEVIHAWLKKAAAVADATLREAGVHEDRVDRVLLVGGRGIVPLIREQVQQLAAGAAMEAVSSDAIALGAAMYSSRLSPCFVPEEGQRTVLRPVLSRPSEPAALAPAGARTADGGGTNMPHSKAEPSNAQELAAAVDSLRKSLVERRVEYAFHLKKYAAWLEVLGRHKDAIELLERFLQDRGLKTEGEEVVRGKLGDLYCHMARKEIDRLAAGVHPRDEKEIKKRIRSYLNQEYCRDHKEARDMKRQFRL